MLSSLRADTWTSFILGSHCEFNWISEELCDVDKYSLYKKQKALL
jgi:hypothetical protein